MRVAVVCGQVPRRAAPEGVAATMIAGHLARAGHSVTLITRNEQGPGRPRRHDPLVRFRPGVTSWRWGGLPSLYRELKRSRPDVVLLLYADHLFDRHPMVTYLPLLCRRLSPPPRLVVEFANVHGAEAAKFSTRFGCRIARLLAGSRGADWELGTLLRDADAIGVYEAEHAEALPQSHSLAADRVTLMPGNAPLRVLPDPNDTIRRGSRWRLGVADDHFVLAFAGELRPDSGIETMLDAVAVARRKVPGIRLLMLDGGTGAASATPYAHRTRQYTVNVGISDCITWVAAGDDEARSTHLRAADACVLPAPDDDSLTAATCHGLPIVTTRDRTRDDDGKPRFVQRRNAILCDATDPASMAAAIVEVARDVRLRETLRAGSLALARAGEGWQAGMRERRRMLFPMEDADRPLPLLGRPRVAGVPPYANARRDVARSCA